VDWRQLIVNCATGTFYQELAISQINKNRRNTSGELHYKSHTQLNVRKTPRQDMEQVKAEELQIALSMTCHCAIRTVDHLSEIMIEHWCGSTLEHKVT